jgi:hypothetical protein
MIANTTQPFEIPGEMRAVAERSVKHFEQAKLAFDTYMRATEKAVSALAGC